MKVSWTLSRLDDAARAAARALADAGVELTLVVAAEPRGAEFRASHANEDGLEVLRFHRADAHPRHWQKSLSVEVARAFREHLANTRPDVVHVHHWRGLTRDLVHSARLEGTPAGISLLDDHVTCLLEERVQPGASERCEATFGALPCLDCARKAGPPTPWVPFEAQFMAFAERERDLVRELSLARFVLVSSAEHAERLARDWPAWKGLAVEPRVVARDDARSLSELYAGAVTLGAPEAVLSDDAWYEERMRLFAQQEWDRKCVEAE